MWLIKNKNKNKNKDQTHQFNLNNLRAVLLTKNNKLRTALFTKSTAQPHDDKKALNREIKLCVYDHLDSIEKLREIPLEEAKIIHQEAMKWSVKIGDKLDTAKHALNYYKKKFEETKDQIYMDSALDIAKYMAEDRESHLYISFHAKELIEKSSNRKKIKALKQTLQQRPKEIEKNPRRLAVKFGQFDYEGAN